MNRNNGPGIHRAEAPRRVNFFPAGGYSALLLIAYAFFCVLMVRISWQYRTLDPDVAFLRIKQDYTPYFTYRLAFFVHAFSAILALPAGFTQFSNQLRRRIPGLHRRAGQVYVWVILLLAGPSGLVLAVVANGGWTSRLGFLLLSFGWWITTWLAWRYGLKRNWRLHRDWMIRSFALTLSAITLRAWKFGLVALFAPPPMDVYRWVAWLGWVVNALVAEGLIFWFFYRSKGSFIQKKTST